MCLSAGRVGAWLSWVLGQHLVPKGKGLSAAGAEEMDPTPQSPKVPDEPPECLTCRIPSLPGLWNLTQGTLRGRGHQESVGTNPRVASGFLWGLNIRMR